LIKKNLPESKKIISAGIKKHLLGPGENWQKSSNIWAPENKGSGWVRKN
jgi:hypothetical protein